MAPTPFGRRPVKGVLRRSGVDHGEVLETHDLARVEVAHLGRAGARVGAGERAGGRAEAEVAVVVRAKVEGEGGGGGRGEGGGGGEGEGGGWRWR